MTTLSSSRHLATLVPWGVEKGAPFGYAVSREQANTNLERIIRRSSAKRF